MIIGNGNYRHGSFLPNPVRDAKSVARVLREKHFHHVIEKTNLTYEGMRNAIGEFTDKIRTDPEVDWICVYFSGHGLQYNGDNYLMPIDANVHVATKIKCKILRFRQC